MSDRIIKGSKAIKAFEEGKELKFDDIVYNMKDGQIKVKKYVGEGTLTTFSVYLQEVNRFLNREFKVIETEKENERL